MRNAAKKFNLTNRQLQVAWLAKKGASYKDIADALQISPLSVGAHVTRLKDKLGARTFPQLVYLLGHFRLPKV